MGIGASVPVAIKDVKLNEATGKLSFTKTDNKVLGPFDIRGLPGPAGKDGVAVVDYIKLVNEAVNNKTFIDSINASVKSGGPGPAGPAGLGIKGAVLNTAGNLLFSTTDDKISFGPFDVRGPTGPAGRGIKSAVLNSAGSLLFTTTDDDVSFGPFDVRGPPGPAGPQGERGIPGADGAQGIPGIGIKAANYDDATGMLTLT